MTATDILAKFADGTATAADIPALVPTRGLVLVLVHVRRGRAPKPRAPIYLLPYKRGPLSSDERKVTHVSGPRCWRTGLDLSVWAAWWRVDALRLWCETWARQPGNRDVVLPWTTTRTTLRSTSEMGRALR